MIRHIVLFRFGDTSDATRTESFATIAAALRPLAATIPGVNSLRVDADPKTVGTHWDAALVSEHQSWDELAAYQEHPAHHSALAVVDPVVSARAIVDYEL